MQISLTIDLEVADEYVEFMDRVSVGTARDHFAGIVQSALSDALGSFPGIVTALRVVADDSGETGGSGKRDTTRNSVPSVPEFRNPVVVASAPRTTHGQTVRNGRPKTLRDMEASDGLPVREYGDRSPESLREKGIGVRKAGADWPSWFKRQQDNLASVIEENDAEQTAERLHRQNSTLKATAKKSAPANKRASFPVRSR